MQTGSESLTLTDNSGRYKMRLSNYFFSKKKKISLVLENNYLISLKPIWLLQPSVKVMGQNKIVTPARL